MNLLDESFDLGEGPHDGGAEVVPQPVLPVRVLGVGDDAERAGECVSGDAGSEGGGAVFGAGDEDVVNWFRHWVNEGFQPLEKILASSPETGTFCHGDTPCLADICLAAQVTNNARFGVDMAPYPVIARINAACMARPAFQKAAPQNQIDAE